MCRCERIVQGNMKWTFLQIWVKQHGPHVGSFISKLPPLPFLVFCCFSLSLFTFFSMLPGLRYSCWIPMQVQLSVSTNLRIFSLFLPKIKCQCMYTYVWVSRTRKRVLQVEVKWTVKVLFVINPRWIGQKNWIPLIGFSLLEGLTDKW